MKQKQKYGIRKLSVGAASCFLGTMLYMQGGVAVHAEEIEPAPAETAEVPAETVAPAETPAETTVPAPEERVDLPAYETELPFAEDELPAQPEVEETPAETPADETSTETPAEETPVEEETPAEETGPTEEEQKAAEEQATAETNKNVFGDDAKLPASKLEEQKAKTQELAKDTSAKEAVDKLNESQKSLDELVKQAISKGIIVKEGKTTKIVLKDGDDVKPIIDALNDIEQQKINIQNIIDKYLDDVKAFEETTELRNSTIEVGSKALSDSRNEVELLYQMALAKGLIVEMNATTVTPEYQSLKGLQGDDLRKAMEENLDLYRKAVSAGINLQDKSAEEIQAAIDLYEYNLAAYNETSSDRQETIDRANAAIEDSRAEIDRIIAIAEAENIVINKTTIRVVNATSENESDTVEIVLDKSLEYVPVEGLEGDELRETIATNLALYKAAVNNAIQVQNDKLKELEALIETVRYNKAAYAKAQEDMQAAVTKGTAEIVDSNNKLQQAIDNAKKEGIIVNAGKDSTNTPAYKDLTGLVGDDLTDAVAYNLDLYQKAINSAKNADAADVKKLNDAVSKLKSLTASYNTAVANVNAEYSKAVTKHGELKSAINSSVNTAKGLGIKTTKEPNHVIKTSYKSLAGLKGQALVDAVNYNNNLVKQYQQEMTTYMNSQKAKLDKAISDYKAGVNQQTTGIKWASGTSVQALSGATKRQGSEVLSGGVYTVQSLAHDAVMGTAGHQNTDMKFGNIFSMNGSSASFRIKNTSNGDVDISIVNPHDVYGLNTTYWVAFWGRNDGGIAVAVYPSAYGGVSGSAGEGGAGLGGSGGSAATRPTYFRSFEYTVSTSKPVSIITFNDIDNNQTLQPRGILDKNTKAKVTTGSKITRSGGENYTSAGGDTSQASAGKIGSNGVQFTFNDYAKRAFHGAIYTSSNANTSIVLGLFGISSDVSIKPEVKYSIASFQAPPRNPEKPTPDTVAVAKHKVTPPPTTEWVDDYSLEMLIYEIEEPEAPHEPSIPEVTAEVVEVEVPDAPEAPEVPEIEVNRYEAEYIPPGVHTGVSGLFGAELMAGLSALGGVLIASRKKEDEE